MRELKALLIVSAISLFTIGCGGGSGGGAGGAPTIFSTDISGVWNGTGPTGLSVTVRIAQPVSGSLRNAEQAITARLTLTTEDTSNSVTFFELTGFKNDNNWTVQDAAITVSQTLTSATTSEGEIDVQQGEGSPFDQMGPLNLTKQPDV